MYINNIKHYNQTRRAPDPHKSHPKTHGTFFQPISIPKKTLTLSSSRLSNGFVQLSQGQSVITQKNNKKRNSWENEGVATLTVFLP